MDRNEMRALAAIDPIKEEDKCPSREIGSDDDYIMLGLEQEAWAGLSERERQENTSVKKANLMRDGFHAGYSAAASDYTNGTATVDHFEGLREQRDVSDFYAIGFELGYLRKLADLLVA